jgi:vacuolar protein-sorting-associated protein 4
MCGNRNDGDSDSTRRAKTEFLVQMQGVGHDENGVLVLGATNLPWALDSAIRRRFERRIYISLPEYEARFGLLKRSMKIDSHDLTEDNFK